MAKARIIIPRSETPTFPIYAELKEYIVGTVSHGTIVRFESDEVGTVVKRGPHKSCTHYVGRKINTWISVKNKDVWRILSQKEVTNLLNN